MGGCFSGGKKSAGQPKQKSNKETAPQPKSGKDAVTFGFDNNFSKLYKLDEELGRGQYGVTYRCRFILPCCMRAQCLMVLYGTQMALSTRSWQQLGE